MGVTYVVHVYIVGGGVLRISDNSRIDCFVMICVSRVICLSAVANFVVLC
jgi:hypothetical protein